MCKPRRIFGSDFPAVSLSFGASGCVAPSRGGRPNAAAVSHGSGFGADSSSSTEGASLKAMRGGAGAAAALSEFTFGTDGPPEAGTLSLADASVPFGESLKAIRFGAVAGRG